MRIDILGLKDSYYPVEMDAVGDTTYTAFMDKVGNWYILRMVTSGSLTSFRYYKGSAHMDLASAWASRTSLSYGYPTVFRGS